MSGVTASDVKELRERTRAGMMDCKKALVEADGDMEKAIEYLREHGLASAEKKAGRQASEGLIESYIHGDGRIGVLVEVNCETDFVANTEPFQELVRSVAMQVAAARPEYLLREDVPDAVVERERHLLRAQAESEGKPAAVIEKIVDGRLDKFFKERCLMEQVYIKDSDKTVEQVVKESVATLGENIQIRRFTRYERGEGGPQGEPGGTGDSASDATT